jgi:putative DNA primase/helicase
MLTEANELSRTMYQVEKNNWNKVLPAPYAPALVADEVVENQFTAESGEMLVRHHRGDFWEWRGPHWAQLEENKLYAALYGVTKHACYSTEKGPKPWNPTKAKITNVSHALAGALHLDQEVQAPQWIGQVDGPVVQDLVSVRNGLLDIQTRRLTAHTPDLFNIVSVPFDFNPHALLPRRWRRFLDELFPDDPTAIALLQEWFGYIISGRTDHHKILGILGPPRSGKGTIARILIELIGADNHVGLQSTFMKNSFPFEPLLNKPLATIPDAHLERAGATQLMDTLLSVSGEDALTVARKYQRQAWTGQLPCRFVVMSNELPGFVDASGAIASRFIWLELTNSWLGNEDRDLGEELRQERPGILNWALDGLQRLNEQGRFTHVVSSEDLVLDAADSVSPIRVFLRECCAMELGAQEPTETLYGAWVWWCASHGRESGTRENFFKKMRAAEPKLRRVKPRIDGVQVAHYQGVRLISEPAMLPTSWGDTL